jgi:hypothetical protein
MRSIVPKAANTAFEEVPLNQVLTFQADAGKHVVL